MKKIFILAALALTLAACSKPESDIRPAENDGMITLTATLAPKGAATKAITDNNDGKITATWVSGEKLAILYEVSGSPQKAEAEVKSVDASGAATIEFTVDGSTTDGTPCTVIYPATAAKDDATGVKSNAELIGNQPGTLDGRLDVRVTTGEISPVNPAAGLVLDAPLAPKYAIVKFSLKNSDDGAITANSLAVTIGTEAFVATSASPASEFYLALPAVSDGTLIFSVPGDAGTSSYCSSKAITKNIEAGKYYRSTVQMTVQSGNADYVPMGDGKNWALKNVGASSPADYGDYFAWGETAPYYQVGYSQEDPMQDGHWLSGKSGYNWENYGFATDYYGTSFTKYTGWDYTVLQSVDDAAAKNLGSPWRMPTIEECQALLKAEDFTWAWVENFNNTGTDGRLVISRKSGFVGNCIFLPAAGSRFYADLSNTGSLGCYWSSSLSSSSPGNAYALYFSPDGAGWNINSRSYGQSVRPVSE